VHDFFRLARLLVNQLIGELLSVALVFLLARCRGLRSHHGDGLFSCRGISAHVPLFVLGDVSRICCDSAHDRYNEHGGSEAKKSGKTDSFATLVLLHLLVIGPGRLKRDLAVVLRDCWVQEKDNIVYVEVDVEADSDCDGNERHQFVKLNLATLLPGELLHANPVWNLANETFTLQLIVGASVSIAWLLL